MKALNIAATGMMAQSVNVEVISHNIANMNTTAFKKQRPEFRDLLYHNIRTAGSPTSNQSTVLPTGLQVGLGVKVSSISSDMKQGQAQMTGDNLDLAIKGAGYFQVELPNGDVGYTRDGAFEVSATGQIVTQEGYILLPGITVPENYRVLEVSNTGEVTVLTQGDQTERVSLGTIELATFINPSGLRRLGDNLHVQTPSSGQPNAVGAGTLGVGVIQQGFLEGSNVNIVSEITDLISAQRAYEMNSKVISSSDEMLRTVSNLR